MLLLTLLAMHQPLKLQETLEKAIYIATVHIRIDNLFARGRKKILFTKMKSNYLKLREDMKNKHIKYKVLIRKNPTFFHQGLKNSIGKEHSQMTNANCNLELSSLPLSVHKYLSEKASLKDTLNALAHYNHLYWITASASSSHTRTRTHKFPWLVFKQQHITPDQKTGFSQIINNDNK